MLLKVDESNLEETSVGIKEYMENGSATKTLLFGDTVDYDTAGVALKITKDRVYLSVVGTDDYDDSEPVNYVWEMDRQALIDMIVSIEGH
jgi:hypothetical protein